MSGKKSKADQGTRVTRAQIVLAVLSLVLIISMVLSALVNF